MGSRKLLERWNETICTLLGLLYLNCLPLGNFFGVSHHQIDDPGEGWLNHLIVITLYQQMHISYFTISFSSPNLHTFNTRNNKMKFLRWILSKTQPTRSKATLPACHLGLYIVEDGIFYNNVGLGHCTSAFCISAFIYISNMHPVITKKCLHLRLLDNKPTTTTTKGLKYHDNIFWMAHELANKLHGSVFFNIFICPDVIFILSCLHPFPQPLSHIIILIHGPIQ